MSDAPPAVEEAAQPDGPTLFDVVPPEPEAPRALPAANEEPPARMVLENVAGHPVPAARHGWRATALIALMGLGGLATAAGSMAWGMSADGASGGFDPQIVSWTGGLMGVSLAAFAAYLFLRGLSDEF